MLDRAHEADLDLFAQHHAEDLLAVPAAHRELNARVLLLEPMQDSGQDVGAHRRGGADREAAATSLDDVRDGAATDIESGQGAMRVREQGAARLGEPAAAPTAHEEAAAQCSFQRLDARGDGGLADEQALGRGGDGSSAIDLRERLEVRELDRIGLCHSSSIFVWLMNVIGRIVLTDAWREANTGPMMIQTPTSTRPQRPADDAATINPWLLWNVETPADRQVLSVAEMAECRCPDLCDRDHANE